MKRSTNWKTRLKANSGQTLVEFAISAILFLLLVFAVIDFSFFFYVKLTLQHAVREAGRYAITGQNITGKNRYASILQTAQDFSLGLATSSNTTVCSTVGGCGSGGGPGDTVTITTTYNYQFITPLLAPFFQNGSYTITASASFKNEPFPPGQT
ncbi:MAG TPA: TadE/TadG family type IV pilus assembly protein [Candidatus Eisenbacteria bacterium]|nr:TadE/TadG family type IV pilus assembly protein [Candidatus Eisenbacteria bacterium]